MQLGESNPGEDKNPNGEEQQEEEGGRFGTAGSNIYSEGLDNPMILALSGSEVLPRRADVGDRDNPHKSAPVRGLAITFFGVVVIVALAFILPTAPKLSKLVRIVVLDNGGNEYDDEDDDDDDEIEEEEEEEEEEEGGGNSSRGAVSLWMEGSVVVALPGSLLPLPPCLIHPIFGCDLMAAVGGPNDGPNKHNVKPTTFLIPTWCSECNDFLFGIHEQGNTCKVCLKTLCFKCSLLAHCIPTPAVEPASSSIVPQSSAIRVSASTVIHDTRQVSLNSPSWCDKCQKFLWGLYNQGNQCRNCTLLLCSDCATLSCRGRTSPCGSGYRLLPFCRIPSVHNRCVGAINSPCTHTNCTSWCNGCGSGLCTDHVIRNDSLPPWLRRGTPSTGEVCEFCDYISKHREEFDRECDLTVARLHHDHRLTPFIHQCWASIYYTLPGGNYCPLDQILLEKNKDVIRGHGVWITHYLLCCPDPDVELLLQLPSEQRVECNQLLCPRKCPTACLFDVPEALLLLSSRTISNERVIAAAMSCLGTNIQSLILSLPAVVHSLESSHTSGKQRKAQIMWDFLVGQAKINFEFLAALFFTLCAFQGSTCIQSFLTSLSSLPEFPRYLLNTGPQIAAMQAGQNSFFVVPVPWYLPTELPQDNPFVSFVKVQTILSGTAPVKYKCLSASGTERNVIFKSGNLFKDHIVCNILQYFKNALEENMECMRGNIVCFKVIPVSPSCGLIQLVENSETLYKIQEGTLADYITDRRRFAYSTAAYTVMVFLLGLCDRHEGNIMIHDHCLSFHIDFEYLVGNETAAEYLLFVPTICIAQEAMSVIDMSKEEFLDLCHAVFVCLQRCLPFVSVILQTILVDRMTYITQANLESFLHSRFMIGLDQNESWEQLSFLIKTALDSLGARALTTNHKIAMLLRELKL
ncbi:phosphoinositide 3-kinase [Pelomyxa schiedti]|nr:phosphoinositide 3-kinase [Pelomyxa schiedti]